MVRIETYKGSVDELVEFVNRVWADAYLGKMTFPVWTVGYFDWQFRLTQEETRRYLLAAYDGSTLAGVLLGTRFLFRSPTGPQDGVQWSWLSIDAKYRQQGIAKALHAERLKRQAEDRAPIIVGFRYVGSEHSLAERPRHDASDAKFNRKIGLWARILDPGRFAAWHWKPLDRWMALIASPFLGVPDSPCPTEFVREFELTDLEACLKLAQDNSQEMQFTIVWDRQTLGHQLAGHPITQTLVLEQDGAVAAFVNFHFLTYQARTAECVAIFDLMVLNRASMAGRLKLLNTALERMREQNVIMALKVRCGDVGHWPLLRTHFVPQPKDSFLVLQSAGEPFEVSSSAALYLLWR